MDIEAVNGIVGICISVSVVTGIILHINDDGMASLFAALLQEGPFTSSRHAVQGAVKEAQVSFSVLEDRMHWKQLPLLVHLGDCADEPIVVRRGKSL